MEGTCWKPKTKQVAHIFAGDWHWYT